MRHSPAELRIQTKRSAIRHTALAAIVGASSLLLAAEAQASCVISGSVTFSAVGGEFLTCTVSEAGVYDIAAGGGHGGNFYVNSNMAAGKDAYGGNGAYISGDVSLAANQVLDIIVGTEAANIYAGTYADQVGGGGGASAVVWANGSSYTPYIVAAGGGGASAIGEDGWANGGGGNIYSGSISPSGGITDTTSTNSYSYGGGGGGFSSPGQSSTGGEYTDGVGGAAFSSSALGMTGGTGGTTAFNTNTGGYGGGGGGYQGGVGDPIIVSSGGTISTTNNGGYSYYDTADLTNITQLAGANNTGGSYQSMVSFDLVSVSSSQVSSSGTSVPEPSGLSILLVAMGLLFGARLLSLKT